MGKFDTVDVAPVILAVAECETKRIEIPARIPGLFDVVYAWLPGSGVAQTGLNTVVYDRITSAGMRMQVGFPVSRRFTIGAQVRCVEFAGGRAAHTTHVGPYSGISAATDALNAWCAQQRLPLAGVGWEVYGDWNDDASKLVTDIYFRLT